MAFKDLFKKKEKKAAPAADKSFGETFKAERKKQGPDGTFTWKGKKYTTKWKEEMAKKPDNSPSKTESAKPPTNSNAPTTPAPKAKNDGPSVGTQLGTAAIGAGAIIGAGVLGRNAPKGRNPRNAPKASPKPQLALPKPSTTPPVKPKAPAKPKSVTKPVTTQNASPKVKAAPKAKPVNPRSAKPTTPKPSAQAPKVTTQAPKAPTAAPKDKAPARPKSSTTPKKPYEWRSNRTLKLTPEMRVSPTVKLDSSTTKTAAEPKPKAKIKPRAVRSKPVITRTSTPKVVNVKMKPRVTRPAPKVVADRVAASKTPTVTKTVELPKPKASTTGTSLVKKTGTDVAKIVPKSTTLSKIGQGALSVLKNPLVRFGLSAPVAGTIEALRPTQMGDGERTNVNQKPSSQADMMKDVNAAAAAKEAKANAPTSSRGPRGETSSEMRGKGYGWDQSSKSWKKTQQSENRTEMNRGGMVKKMSSGGSIARGGGAAKRGTKFKGSF
jgi:hypothetical protein